MELLWIYRNNRHVKQQIMQCHSERKYIGHNPNQIQKKTSMTGLGKVSILTTPGRYRFRVIENKRWCWHYRWEDYFGSVTLYSWMKEKPVDKHGFYGKNGAIALCLLGKDYYFKNKKGKKIYRCFHKTYLILLLLFLWFVLNTAICK